MCACERKGYRCKWLSGSRHGGLGVLVEETRDRVVVDERVVGEPFDRAAVGTGVAEGVPRRQQARVLVIHLGFEPAEGALALESPRNSPPRAPAFSLCEKS